MTQLTYDVHVCPGIPTSIDDLPPGIAQRMWSPIASTLIAGERDAVLVDPPMTIAQSDALVAWLDRQGKNVTTIYITHGHGDHWFGISAVLRRFPAARAVATAAVVAYMERNGSPQMVESFWAKRFPGQLPERLIGADVLEGDHFELEGHELAVIGLGHTDTDDTTCLHVPDLGLVVAGDAAYNDTHLYLAESPPEGRTAWLAAIDTMEALAPRAVVAGHKRPQRADDPAILAETREYILAFSEVAEKTSTTLGLYEEMLTRYPDRVNPGALWGSARATKGWD